MPTSVVSLTHQLDQFPASSARHRIREELERISATTAGMAAGASPVSALAVGAHSVAATGTLTIASGSGPVGGTINGTAKTVTWATSDTATATALAAAINADATLGKFIVASSAAGVVTLTAFPPGALGNCCTLVASGTGVTASGAKLTGGANDAIATFSR